MKHRPYVRLKAALRSQKLTYREIGLLLGISESAVFRKINGVSDFYIDETQRMLEAYSLPLTLFLCK